MKDYIERSIDLFGLELTTTVSSPRNKGLHGIYRSSTRLENNYAEIIQSIVAKKLWVKK